MISWDGVRASVYTAVLAAYPNTEVIVPGAGDPDLTTRKAPFIMLQIEPKRSEQMALGSTPPKRRFGSVEICIFVKENQGDKVAFDLLEIADNLFTAKTLSDIVFSQTLMLTPTRGVGWKSHVTLASFYFDNINS